MSTEIKTPTMAEYLALSNRAEQEAANKDLAEAATEYKSWAKQGDSAYKKLLESQKPQDESGKITHFRDMAKAQALTDFFTSLTTGVIGSATKGYAPKTNDKTSPYVAELKNLQQLNDARNEKYKQLQNQVEFSKWEQEGKTALANYEAAQKRARKAEERGWEIQKMAVQQAHQKQLSDDRIQGANDRAQTAAAAKKAEEAARKAASEKNRYLIGNDYEISYDKMKGLVGLYAELTRDGKVPKYTTKGGLFGPESEFETLTPDQMAVWLTANIGNEYVQDSLNKLSKKENSGVYTTFGDVPWNKK